MPGEHNVWLSEPVEQNEPAGHLEHWALLPRPRSLLKLPAAHGSGADAPASQYEPATHSRHAVAPLALMNEPASQLAHVPWLALGCTVPGEHSVGSAAPVEQKAPAGQPTQSSFLVIDKLSAVIVPFWWRPDGHGSGADAPTSQ